MFLGAYDFESPIGSLLCFRSRIESDTGRERSFRLAVPSMTISIYYCTFTVHFASLLARRRFWWFRHHHYTAPLFSPWRQCGVPSRSVDNCGRHDRNRHRCTDNMDGWWISCIMSPCCMRCTGTDNTHKNRRTPIHDVTSQIRRVYVSVTRVIRFYQH